MKTFITPKAAIFCLVLLFINFQTQAQTKEEQAKILGRSAIELMDNGQIKESLTLLKKAQKLDPDNTVYSYEMAYAHYLNKDYKAAIKILSKQINHPQAKDYTFQLLGNSYSMSNQREKAIECYEKGMVRFPSSGKLYLERGTMELKKEDFNTALDYYEKGIEVDPNFPSNYYWATRLYGMSSERIWSLIYGEIFMNLERNSNRTVEISKLLYDTYKESITIENDTVGKVSFSKIHTISLEDIGDMSNLKMPFALIAYAPLMTIATVGEKAVDIHSLNKIRTHFIQSYFQNDTHEKYPNALFEYQKQILEAGHFESYNYWLLMKGEEVTFSKWVVENEAKFDQFVDWYTENYLVLSEDFRFYRSQY